MGDQCSRVADVVRAHEIPRPICTPTPPNHQRDSRFQRQRCTQWDTPRATQQPVNGADFRGQTKRNLVQQCRIRPQHGEMVLEWLHLLRRDEAPELQQTGIEQIKGKGPFIAHALNSCSAALRKAAAKSSR